MITRQDGARRDSEVNGRGGDRGAFPPKDVLGAFSPVTFSFQADIFAETYELAE